MPDVRLIDANALLVTVAHRNALDVLPGVNFERSWIYATVQNDMFKLVENAPTISAVPVAHGRWVRANDEQAYFDVEYVCSGCQFVVAVSGIGTPILYGYKFCPHCGLPMDAKDMDVPTKDGGASDGV